jgi:hypothetical protein
MTPSEKIFFPWGCAWTPFWRHLETVVLKSVRHKKSARGGV